jgi:hypothetical protein
MTRAERAAEKVRREKERLAAAEQRAKDKLAEQRRAVAQAEAIEREETRKAVHKRCYHVGALAHEAGLFAWSNADLAAVFAVLATLGNMPHPAAVLEAVLGAERALDALGGNGDVADITLPRFPFPAVVQGT